MKRLMAGIFILFAAVNVVIAQQQILPAPVFSSDHGYYIDPFSLVMTCPDPEAAIYYTTDGSDPRQGGGILYINPLDIGHTSVIRAIAVKNSMNSQTTTRTYLFAADIILQGNSPEGYPSAWADFTTIQGSAPADYEMDPELMADPSFASSCIEALLDLPVISLVTNKEYFFSKSTNPETGGIYIYTGVSGGFGNGWVRPVSYEFFNSGESPSFQVDCGVEIQGGEGRRPEKSPKHSFRLVFRSEYGPSRFNYPLFGNNADSSFNSIILRAGFGNTWIHWKHSERSMAQYLRDRWTKDTHQAMGHISSHGIYVHLYINGLYWGIYNPSERLDNDFAVSYLGGEKEDYDVIKDYTEVVDGDAIAWNKMMYMVNAGVAGNDSYQALRGNKPDGSPDPYIEPMVDVISLTDYMILNFYGGNWDWDHHNWVAIRNRANPDNGFRFFCWDSEHVVESVTANFLSENNNNCPSRIFQQLRQNKDFVRLFADRVQRFCFNGGALTPAAAAERWMDRSETIEKAVIAESARWGDYRRDVHPWQTEGPFHLYTKEDHWVPQMNYILGTYFPNRTSQFISQLRKADLFPEIDAPSLLLNGIAISSKEFDPGDILTMSSEKGYIWYTTDGIDPATSGTMVTISSSAKMYLGPVTLNESSHIIARVLYNGEWSAASEYFFVQPDDFHDIRITEIHYHPSDEGDIDDREFEFIEIKNTGTSNIDIGGLRFTDGISYEFPQETQLLPKGFIVLASNSKSFYDRYGYMPFDEYDGQLSNEGELIVLVNAENDTLCNLSYSNINGWPVEPDTDGNSLVPVEFNPAVDQNNPVNWRASYTEGGSPGYDDIFNITDGTSTELFALFPNYPNPFNEMTYLPFRLNEAASITVSVYDITGRQIAVIETSDRPAGFYTVEWDGCVKHSGKVPGGLYFYRLEAKGRNNTGTLTRKMVLVR